MRRVYIPLFWRITGFTNITVSGLKILFFIFQDLFIIMRSVYFPFICQGHGVSWDLYDLVACQNSEKYTVRMIVKVANRPFYGFSQIFILTNKQNFIATGWKNTLELVYLSSLGLICGKMVKILLGKISVFLQRNICWRGQVHAPQHTNV